MKLLENHFLGGAGGPLIEGIPFPSTDADAVAGLLSQCPAHATTPLVESVELANAAQCASFAIKDERSRMGLGSFKALGAAYVIACDAVATGNTDLKQALNGKTYITASAGNHGLSVAAGARLFGADAVIVLSQTVPEDFAGRLEAKGATVIREGEDYEASMAHARKLADDENWTLLSDSSWDGYVDMPWRLMEGYLQLAVEACADLKEPPSHVFLQCGVGGFAGAVAAWMRKQFGDKPIIVVVEPEAAPAQYDSIQAGKAIACHGPVSNMGRLDCKEPSLIALNGLARDANFLITISDDVASAVLPALEQLDLATTPSGSAGIAAALLLSKSDNGMRQQVGLDENSTVLAFITEGTSQ